MVNILKTHQYNIFIWAAALSNIGTLMYAPKRASTSHAALGEKQIFSFIHIINSSAFNFPDADTAEDLL